MQWQFKDSSLAIKVLDQLFEALYQHRGEVPSSTINFLHFIIENNFAYIVVSRCDLQKTDGRMIICTLKFRHVWDLVLKVANIAKQGPIDNDSMERK